MASTNYKDSNQYDTIVISESEDSRDFEESSTVLDAEIIDDGVSEEECEQYWQNLQSPPNLSTGTPVTASRVSDNIKKTNCLCINVVDCDKYPWYYSKYKEQILSRKHFKTLQREVTDDRDLGVSETPSLVSSSKAKGTSLVIVKSKNGDYAVKEDTSQTKITIPKTLSDENNKTEKVISHKKSVKSEKKPSKKKRTAIYNKINTDLSHDIYKNSTNIDYKKNTGLIGMKIQMMKVDDKSTEKSITKSKKKKHREKESKHHHSKINVNAKEKTSSNITQSENKEKEPEVSQSNIFSEFPIDDISQKHVSLKCKLKIPKEKALEVIKKRYQKTSYKKLIDDSQIIPSNAIQKKANSECENFIDDPYKKQLTEFPGTVSNFSKDEKSNKGCNNEIFKKNCKNVIYRKPMPKSKRVEMDNLRNERNKINCKKSKDVKSLPAEKIKFSLSHEDKQVLKKLSVNDICSSLSESNLVSNTSTGDNILKGTICSVSSEVANKEQNNATLYKSVVMPTLEMPVNDTNIPTECSHTMCKKMKSCNFAAHFKSMDLTPKMKKRTSENVGIVSNKTTSEKLRDMRIIKSIATDCVSLITQLNQSQKASVSHQMKSRRKQPIKIRSIKAIGNTDNYMQGNGMSKSIINLIVSNPSQKPYEETSQKTVNVGKNKEIYKKDLCTTKKLQQDILQNMKYIDNYINRGVESSKPQQNHFPIQTMVTGIEHDNNNRPSMNTYITQNSQKPNEIGSANIDKNNAPAAVDSMWRPYGNTFHPKANILSRCLTALPPFSTITPSVRQRTQFQPEHTRKLLHDQPYSTSMPQRMPIHNVTCLGKINNLQNSNMQPQKNSPKTGQILQTILSNASMPPGICDVHPLNVPWPSELPLKSRTMVTPPPYQENSNRIVENSVIGRNNDGVIKKINISKLSTVDVKDKNDKNKTEDINKNLQLSKCSDLSKESTKSPPDFDSPVTSKIEMMKELEMAMMIESPEKNDIKRPSPFENSADLSTNVKCLRPGPLSKKIKFMNNVCGLYQNMQQTHMIHDNPPRKQYSPPILPIPTYQTILAEIQTPTHDISLSPPQNINTCANIFPKISAKDTHIGEIKEDSSKEFSLKEYEKKTANMESKRDDGPIKKQKGISPSFKPNVKANCSKKPKHSAYFIDTDLGYVSDSKSIRKLQELF